MFCGELLDGARLGNIFFLLCSQLLCSLLAPFLDANCTGRDAQSISPMVSDVEANEQFRSVSVPLAKAEKMKLFASTYIGMKMNYHYAKGFSK